MNYEDFSKKLKKLGVKDSDIEKYWKNGQNSAKSKSKRVNAFKEKFNVDDVVLISSNSFYIKEGPAKITKIDWNKEFVEVRFLKSGHKDDFNLSILNYCKNLGNIDEYSKFNEVEDVFVQDEYDYNEDPEKRLYWKVDYAKDLNFPWNSNILVSVWEKDKDGTFHMYDNNLNNMDELEIYEESEGQFSFDGPETKKQLINKLRKNGYKAGEFPEIKF